MLSTILVVYLWGSCIAYLVIIGDSFSPLLALAAGKPCPLRMQRACCGGGLSCRWRSDCKLRHGAMLLEAVSFGLSPCQESDQLHAPVLSTNIV